MNEWHDLPLDVVGLDWRLPIEEARARGVHKAVQKYNPSFLLAPWSVIEEHVKGILDQGMKEPGYIFLT